MAAKLRTAIAVLVCGIGSLQNVSLADEKTPPAAADADGFVSLFNGVNLEGWQGATAGYEVKDGVLMGHAKGGGKLFTKKQFDDFILRFEFKLTPGANSGIGIRTPLQGDPAYVGMEIQVLDNTSPRYAALKEYQYHGSVYGVVPARRGFLRPVGQWNEEEITCRGNHVTVKLNGETIVDADVKKASTPKTIDGKQHPGLLRKQGHIGLLGHGSDVAFRNLRIKPLRSDPPAENSGAFNRDTIDLGVVTQDVERSARFYTEAIGFTELPGFSVPANFCTDVGLTAGQPLTVRVFALANNERATRVKLIELPDVESKPGDNATIHAQLGFRYLTIHIADTDAALVRLKKSGVVPLANGPVELPKGLPQGVYLTVVRDPDGNLIELVGPKKAPASTDG